MLAVRKLNTVPLLVSFCSQSTNWFKVCANCSLSCSPGVCRFPLYCNPPTKCVNCWNSAWRIFMITEIFQNSGKQKGNILSRFKCFCFVLFFSFSFVHVLFDLMTLSSLLPTSLEVPGDSQKNSSGFSSFCCGQET